MIGNHSKQHMRRVGLCACAMQAAAAGDVPQLRLLLAAPQLNTSRNIVPDDVGFARVLEVALWAAVRNNHIAAVEVSGEGAGGG